MLLAATCTRHRYTRDPAPVIAELSRIAGARTDILARVAGGWAAHYRNEDTRELADALGAIEGAGSWIESGGQRRRNAPPQQ